MLPAVAQTRKGGGRDGLGRWGQRCVASAVPAEPEVGPVVRGRSQGGGTSDVDCSGGLPLQAALCLLRAVWCAQGGRAARQTIVGRGGPSGRLGGGAWIVYRACREVVAGVPCFLAVYYEDVARNLRGS